MTDDEPTNVEPPEAATLSVDELWKVCIHEAAHAVMTVHIGGRIKSIDLTTIQTLAGPSAGRVEDDSPNFHSGHHGLVGMSGVAAEEVLLRIDAVALDADAYLEGERLREALEERGSVFNVEQFRNDLAGSRINAVKTIRELEGMSEWIRIVADRLKRRYEAGERKWEGAELEQVLAKPRA